MRKPTPAPAAKPANGAAKARVAKAPAGKVSPAPKKPNGRPPHEPTEQSRMIVKLGCLAGLSQERIAPLVGIDPTTLRAHYRAELAEGGDGLMVKVVGTLAAIATDKNHPKAATAAIWLTRTRLGWRDGMSTESPGPEGEEANDGAGPVPKGTVFTLQLTGARNLQVVGGKDAV